MTDIKCHTFSEPQPRADLNEDGNFRNGGNVRNIQNGTFLPPKEGVVWLFFPKPEVKNSHTPHEAEGGVWYITPSDTGD